MTVRQSGSSKYAKGFLQMCLANFLVCVHVFMAIPSLFQENWSEEAAVCNGGWAALAFVAGMYLPGPFNAYIVERFFRQQVCLRVILLLALDDLLLLYVHQPVGITLLYGLQGAFFAIIQMALGGTLVNDLNASQNRTISDMIFAWIGRLCIPIGLALGIWMNNYCTISDRVWIAVVPLVVAWLLVSHLSIPFKAPVRVRCFSSDRFWLTKSLPLFLTLLPIAFVQGVIVGRGLSVSECLMIAGGSLLAACTQWGVFRNADERAEMVCGIAAIAASLLLFWHDRVGMSEPAFFFLGFGGALSTARFLMYFLKLSGHCQRGTSQNMHLLSWYTGFFFGFFCALQSELPMFLWVILIAIVLAIYLIWLHPWFLRHKDRDFKFREG